MLEPRAVRSPSAKSWTSLLLAKKAHSRGDVRRSASPLFQLFPQRIVGVVDYDQYWPLAKSSLEWITLSDAARVGTRTFVWKRNQKDVSKRALTHPTHTILGSAKAAQDYLSVAKHQDHEAAANEGRGNNVVLSSRCKRVVHSPPLPGCAPPWRRQNHFSFLIASVFFGDRTKAAGREHSSSGYTLLAV